jgi:hypothetical protein
MALSGINTSGLTSQEVSALETAQTTQQQQEAFQTALNQLLAEGMDYMAAQQEIQQIIGQVHG